MYIEIGNYMQNIKPLMKKLLKELLKEFKYASILATDSCGKNYTVSKTSINIEEAFFNERGFVVRVYNGSNYSEYAFDKIDESNIKNIVEQKIQKSKLIQKNLGMKKSLIFL